MIELWIKAFHVISVIAWMAGMFYLPRLYVYHVSAKPGSELSETFKVMERKLLKMIINPAMMAAWVFGLALVILQEQWLEIWFLIKFSLVFAMSAFHGFLSKWRKEFERDENKRTEKFYRLANEVPTLLMVLIVIMVIVKPV